MAWNYLATLLQMGSGILLFPLILRLFPSETVGVWSVFTMIASLTGLLEFGFTPSFTRNITYIFSGVNVLVTKGINTHDRGNSINFSLLKNTIQAMKWFYSRIALVTVVALLTGGTWYLKTVLNKGFQGDHSEIIVAWIVFCLISTYNIYTLYYDSLLLGVGKQIISKKIMIISQLLYITTATVMMLAGYGLISIVVGQAVMILVKRVLSYKAFFNRDLRQSLHNATPEQSPFEIIKVLAPNSFKVGLTGLGSFLVMQSSILIGSLYLRLEDLASYGISAQIVNVAASMSMVYYYAYIPKIAYLRVQKENDQLLGIFYKSLILMFFTFLISAVVVSLVGNEILVLVKAKTFLVEPIMLAVMFLIAFLERNHATAGGFILLNNEVPFFKASLLSGAATFILLFVLIYYFNAGVWGMILAPGIAQLVYQNWKWPLVLIRQLKSEY